MHIIVAFLTALASVLYALDRLGVDLGWFNPWSWKRRRHWQKKYYANPAFGLTEPMDAMALLLVATAKIDGEISIEEKNELLAIFSDVFQQSAEQSSSLLRSSIYLLGTGDEVYSRVADVLNSSLEKFSEAQKHSSLELLQRVASIGGPPSEPQKSLIKAATDMLIPKPIRDKWG